MRFTFNETIIVRLRASINQKITAISQGDSTFTIVISATVIQTIVKETYKHTYTYVHLCTPLTSSNFNVCCAIP